MCLEEREGRLYLIHRRREWNTQRVVEERAYALGLDAATSRILRQGGDGPDYWAYVDGGRHLHYVSYWMTNKIRVMHAPRSSHGDLEVLSPHYARIGDALHCQGTWMPDADAGSFRLVPETRFAQDREHVYAFTITEGLDVLDHAERPRHFLPCCEHFTDGEAFYWQSNRSRRIERVHADTRIDAYEKRTVMQSCLWHHAEAGTETEEQARAGMLDQVRTVADLFGLLLPHAGAEQTSMHAATT